MLTVTSEYVIRALSYLARHADEWPITGRTIAAELKMPSKYLSKILGDLARLEWVDSAPGKKGGFRLAKAPREMALFDVLQPFERFEHRRCPFGDGVCTDDDPCALHQSWAKVVETEMKLLKRTTVWDVAFKKGDAPHPKRTTPSKTKPRMHSQTRRPAFAGV